VEDATPAFTVFGIVYDIEEFNPDFSTIAFDAFRSGDVYAVTITDGSEARATSMSARAIAVPTSRPSNSET